MVGASIDINIFNLEILVHVHLLIIPVFFEGKVATYRFKVETGSKASGEW